ncbi:hypothetical protein [Lacticaseibacillus daqingensis]|uniref:hypothetical protein n=1 Tax=Lacticaseibacillus daqingensis TaxID=2486014 RepID=UPI000F77E661|nr:hypothetical protein [Lacticaseibacillus daqingensis]
MTDETTRWLLAQAQALAAAADQYEDRAFYQELQAFIQAQAQRLDQAAGEVDGRTWDHAQW